MISRKYSWSPMLLVASALILSCRRLDIGSSSALPSHRVESWAQRYLLVDKDLVPDSYLYLIARGEEHLSAGRYSLAAEAFEAALDWRFVEAPNFEIVVRIAEAACLSGEKESGVRFLDSFNCMLDVEVGELGCFSRTSDAIPVRNSELSDFCFERMCSDAYLAYYDAPTDRTRARVAELREEAVRVRSICDLPHKISKLL